MGPLRNTFTLLLEDDYNKVVACPAKPYQALVMTVEVSTELTMGVVSHSPIIGIPGG